MRGAVALVAGCRTSYPRFDPVANPDGRITSNDKSLTYPPGDVRTLWTTRLGTVKCRRLVFCSILPELVRLGWCASAAPILNPSFYASDEYNHFPTDQQCGISGVSLMRVIRRFRARGLARSVWRGALSVVLLALALT